MTTDQTNQANQTDQHESQPGSDFAQQAEERSPGLIAEFWEFLIHNKKWWLIPIVLVLLLIGVLILLGGSSAVAPFIYPLF